jgi:hypothetical protein
MTAALPIDETEPPRQCALGECGKPAHRASVHCWDHRFEPATPPTLAPVTGPRPVPPIPGVVCPSCGHGDTVQPVTDDQGRIVCACGTPVTIGAPDAIPADPADLVVTRVAVPPSGSPPARLPAAPAAPAPQDVVGYLYRCGCCGLMLCVVQRPGYGYTCDLCIPHVLADTHPDDKAREMLQAHRGALHAALAGPRA